MGIAIIEYIRNKNIKNTIVYQKEFLGYSGEEPSLEIIIPNRGAVVFGEVSVEKGLEIIEKYLINTEQIIEFLVNNNGIKKCNHNH